MKDKKPNILLIVLDTFRADYLSAYGGAQHPRTLDGLAKNGTVYAHAIAPATYTTLSHMSLFTGKRAVTKKALSKATWKYTEYPIRSSLASGGTTLAGVLRQKGYATSLFLGNESVDASNDFAPGFSNICGESASGTQKHLDVRHRMRQNELANNLTVSAISLISRLMSRRQIDSLLLGSMAALGKLLNKKYGYYSIDRGASALNSQVDAYLNEADQRSKFMFLKYMEVGDGYPTNLITHEYIEQNQWPYISHVLDPEPVKIIRAACMKRLAYLDRKFAELLDIFRKHGVLDDAVLVLTSDHGQAFLEHNQLYHVNFPYEQIAHVPLIDTRFQNGKQVNTRESIDGAISLTQLYNAIPKLARSSSGMENWIADSDFLFCDHLYLPNPLVNSIFRTMKDRSNYFSAFYKTLLSINTSASAIYYKNYKLMHFYKYPERNALYDLSQDKKEETNLIKENRQLALKMLRINKARTPNK
jgi:hypothetical protein